MLRDTQTDEKPHDEVDFLAVPPIVRPPDGHEDVTTSEPTYIRSGAICIKRLRAAALRPHDTAA